MWRSSSALKNSLCYSLFFIVYVDSARGKVSLSHVGTRLSLSKLSVISGGSVERSSTSEPLLPEGWVSYIDESSGLTYYSNTITGETTWEYPNPSQVPQDFVDNDSFSSGSTETMPGTTVISVFAVVNNASL
jgi:hypothetical protein